MFPILFNLGPFTLHTYGLFVALGVLLGIHIAVRLAMMEGFEREKIENALYSLLFFLVVGGIIGGRIFYVVVYRHEFSGDILEIFKVWQGGLVSYGGLLGAFAGFFLWYKKSKIFPWKKVVDWLAPSLAFGHALGRLGCFFAGCCYGLPTDRPWGIVFSDSQTLAPIGFPLHPTQLYEFVFLTFLGLFLWWRFIKLKRMSIVKIDGVIFADYLILYSVGRFLIEFFRGDDPRVLGMTPGQMMSILVLIASGFFRFFLFSSFKKTNNESNLHGE